MTWRSTQPCKFEMLYRYHAGSGDGIAVPLNAGAELVNMEMINRHAGVKNFARAGQGTWMGVIRDYQGKPVGKYLNDWSGPEGELKKVDYRLGVPCFPGHTLTISGKVTKKYVENGEHLVDVEYQAVVPIGPHATGKGTLALPSKS